MKKFIPYAFLILSIVLIYSIVGFGNVVAKNSNYLKANFTFCKDCKTMEDAIVFENSIGSEEVHLTCEQEMNLFFHHTLSLNSSLNDCEPSRDVRIKSQMVLGDIFSYKYFLHKKNTAFYEITQYEYLNFILAEEENYCKVNENLLTYSKTLIFSHHPYFDSSLLKANVANNNNFIELVEYYKSFINKINASFYEPSVSLYLFNRHRIMNAKSTEASADTIMRNSELEDILDYYLQWCCQDLSITLGFIPQLPYPKYYRDRRDPKGNFFVPPPSEDQDVGEYYSKYPTFFEIYPNDLALEMFVFYRGNFVDNCDLYRHNCATSGESKCNTNK